MRWHTVDYLKRDGRRHRTLLDRGFWFYNIPRLIPLCRLRGHRPVVDGVEYDGGLRSSRWVACDRCGIRPEPQGRLDPAQWHIGDAYDGPYRTDWRFQAIKAGSDPGPWPSQPTGTIGGQLVIGESHSTGFEIKIGNPGSEHVLAANVTIQPLGALYLHTEQHGRWLQRRLNPTGYESRVIGVSVHGGHLYWKLWAKRGGWSHTDPRWQQGSFRIDPRDILLGYKRWFYEDVGDPVDATVRMPHGDDHPVLLQLQRKTLRRQRGGRGRHQWGVDWKSPTGIPTKPGGRGQITGSGVDISDSAAVDGYWVGNAIAAIAAQLTRDRTRYGYQPEPLVTDEEPMRG